MQRLLRGERAERAADQQLVYGEQDLTFFAKVMNVQQIRVGQGVKQLHDLQQPDAEIGLRRKLRANEPQRPRELGRMYILGAKQLAEPIATELLDEPEASEHDADLGGSGGASSRHQHPAWRGSSLTRCSEAACCPFRTIPARALRGDQNLVSIINQFVRRVTYEAKHYYL